jgi:hypothetical protein
VERRGEKNEPRGSRGEDGTMRLAGKNAVREAAAAAQPNVVGSHWGPSSSSPYFFVVVDGSADHDKYTWKFTVSPFVASLADLGAPPSAREAPTPTSNSPSPGRVEGIIAGSASALRRLRGEGGVRGSLSRNAGT